MYTVGYFSNGADATDLGTRAQLDTVGISQISLLERSVHRNEDALQERMGFGEKWLLSDHIRASGAMCKSRLNSLRYLLSLIIVPSPSVKSTLVASESLLGLGACW